MQMRQNRKINMARVSLFGFIGAAGVLLGGMQDVYAQTNNAPLIEISPATPTSPAPSPETQAAPAPAVTAPAPATTVAVPPVAADNDAKPAAPLQPDNYLNTAPEISLLFRPEEIAALRKALAAYERNKNAPKNNEDDYLSKLGDMADKVTGENKETSSYFVYPQFFLESLAYHSPTDWIVHISHRALTQDNVEVDGLRVISIDQDKVLLEWKPIDMQKVNESWAIAHNDNIMVDAQKKLVEFTLRPNQTFSSYVMRVLEGKLDPVVVIVNNTH